MKLFSRLVFRYSVSSISFVISLNILTDVYALCVANPEPFGEDLYKATKKYLEEHVTNLLKVRTVVKSTLLYSVFTLLNFI